MNLSLNDKESKTFHGIINGEVRCCVNQWDDDTCRMPSQKRLKDAKHGHAILDKWQKTQSVIPGTNFIDLGAVVACNLDLTLKEVTYSKNLLTHNVKELRKALQNVPTPYTGVYLMFDEEATNAENILARI